MSMRVCISPFFDKKDNADGGIRRVVSAQRRWLPEFDIDVVDSPLDADIFACHALTPHGPWDKARRPLIVSHNHGLYWSEYEWASWAVDVNLDVIESLDRADAMTAPSKWVARVLERGWLKSVEVLYHGVDIEDWPLQESQGYVLWNKTRVDAVCDAEAVSTLAKLAPNVPFVSTFGATGIDNLELVQPASWEEHKPLVQHAGVYLATTRETFGIGTIEAMAAGVPVLGWDWGGQHEFVKHGETGWLSRPGDYEGLLAGLDWCLTNRARLGKAARACVVGSFTWHDAIERYANLYAKLLDGRQDDSAMLGGVAPREPRSVDGGSNKPRATIVIPCYKLERFLDEAVASAIALPNVEVLVVDDCSPGDGSGTSARQIAETHGSAVRYLRTPENLYLAGVLNWAIKQAKSDIIIPIDADNYFGPAADELIKALEHDRGIDIAYGRMKVLVYDENEQLGREYISAWPHDFQFPAQIQGHNQIPSTAAFRKSLWSRIGGYRERCKTADDADFWCRATSYGGKAVKATDGITLVYRDLLTSMSHSVEPWAFQDWYTWSRKSALTPLGADMARPARKRHLKIPTHEPCLVSIIIPVGPGHDKYLPDAIDSVLSQTDTRWELIIVNDTGEPLSWMPPCATYLSTAKPGDGPAIARNLGLNKARGLSFLFLDADDYLQPNAIEWLWEVYKAKDGKHFVYGDFIDQPNGTTEAMPDYTPDMFLRKSPIPVTFMGPMWAVQKGLKFDEALTAWEDWDFFLRMCELGICGTHVTVPTFNYRTTIGTRRESMYEKRDELKQEIWAKWGEYVKGDKVMPCSSCGKSTWTVSPPAMNQADPNALKAALVNGEFVPLEYTGPQEGTHSYRGPRTGTDYRFGHSAGHKVKYVHKDDAATFLASWPNWFKLYDQERSATAAQQLVTAVN
jgi:glycosyltransferase involved in cell wall biosynthesis